MALYEGQSVGVTSLELQYDHPRPINTITQKGTKCPREEQEVTVLEAWKQTRNCRRNYNTMAKETFDNQTVQRVKKKRNDNKKQIKSWSRSLLKQVVRPITIYIFSTLTSSKDSTHPCWAIWDLRNLSRLPCARRPRPRKWSPIDNMMMVEHDNNTTTFKGHWAGDDKRNQWIRELERTAAVYGQM